MAYLSPFLRIRINGMFGSAAGPEQWSTGVKIHLVGGSVDPTQLLAAIAPAISTFHSHNDVRSGGSALLTELTGAVIGTDGKYVGGAAQATKRYTYPTPVAGAGTSIHPWAMSMVLSLRSSLLGRGPGSHGRMYWPATGVTVAPDGRFAASNRDLIVAHAATMLKAINAASVAEFGAGNVIVNTSPVREGHRSSVDRVWVGNRPDSMESRENAIPEVYSVANV